MFARQMSIYIQATPEAVYEYIADPRRHGEWAAQPLEIQIAPDAVIAPGTTFTSTVQFMGAIQAQGRIVSVEPPTRFTFECADNGRYLWSFQVQPEGTGTRLTYGFERLSAPAWVKAIQPWLLWPLVGKPGLNKALAKIKANLEPATQPHLA